MVLIFIYHEWRSNINVVFIKGVVFINKKNSKRTDTSLAAIFFSVYSNGGGLVNSSEKIRLSEYDSKRLTGDRKYIGI